MKILFKSRMILFVFICVFISAFSSALTLDDNIIIRNTGSNTGITFNQEIEVSEVRVEKNFILLSDIKYERPGLNVSISELRAIWENRDFDSSAFPHLITDKDGLKEIISNISQNVNATLSFIVRSCDDLENIQYSNPGSSKIYNKDNFVCVGNRVSLDVRELAGDGYFLFW